MKGCGTKASYDRGCKCTDCKTANNAYHKRLREERRGRHKTADFRHGPTGYTNWGCRCDICATAHRDRDLRGAKRRREQADNSGLRRHGLAGYSGWGCRCQTCKDAATEKARKRAIAAGRDPKNFRPGLPGPRPRVDPDLAVVPEDPPEIRKRKRALRVGRAHVRANAKSRDTAINYGNQWTGPELEIISRTDLTVPQMAKLLGRTIAGVRAQRRLINRADPLKTMLAGIPR